MINKASLINLRDPKFGIKIIVMVLILCLVYYWAPFFVKGLLTDIGFFYQDYNLTVLQIYLESLSTFIILYIAFFCTYFIQSLNIDFLKYEDVFALIKFSKAVINPSLFEGWSSTVEECKSVGKNMILSDLNVHKEQYPESLFFERNSVDSLKNILKDYNVENKFNVEDLETRTKLFANNYEEIILKVLHD